MTHIGGLLPGTNYSYLVYALYDLCAAYQYRGGPAVFRRVFCDKEKPKTVVHCSETGSFLTALIPPSSPKNLRLASNVNKTLRFTWEPPLLSGGGLLAHYVINWTVDGQRLSDTLNDTSWNIDDSTQNEPYSQLMLQVAAVNDAGVGDLSPVFNYSPLETEDKRASNSSVFVIALSTLGTVIFVATVVIVALCFRRRIIKANLHNNATLEDDCPKLPKEVTSLPQVGLKDVSICRELGAGQFGSVFEGFVRNLAPENLKAQRVAFKTIQPRAPASEKQQLLTEALTMRNMKHPNIVKLLGLCIEGDEMWIILEMMDGGDLLGCLRSWRSTANMPSLASMRDLIRISRDLASGCACLSKLGYVHRDLAARNCLLDCKNPTDALAKIGDFGLTRSVYDNDASVYRLKADSKIPIRWSAPEVLERCVFEKASDIWSFGVTMWEIITLGTEPYAGFCDSEVISKVRSGYKLCRPRCCPRGVFTIIDKCFNPDPCCRPPFEEIVSFFTVLLAEQHCDGSAKSRIHRQWMNAALLVPSNCNRCPLVPQTARLRNKNCLSSILYSITQAFANNTLANHC